MIAKGGAVLALDFDGVLHAHDLHFTLEDVRGLSSEQLLEAGLFVHRGLLAYSLAPFRGVQVVVHSAWRKTIPMSTIRDVLGPLASRLLGVTPVEVDDREQSILEFLRRRHMTAERLVILDDQPSLFDVLRPKVIATHPTRGYHWGDSQWNLWAALRALKVEVRG